MKERMRRLIVVLTLFLCITAAASADMIWCGLQRDTAIQA